MTTCLGKSCSFGLLRVSFVGVCQILCVCPSFPFDIEGWMWDVIVLIADHCLSICFDEMKRTLKRVVYPSIHPSPHNHRHRS